MAAALGKKVKGGTRIAVVDGDRCKPDRYGVIFIFLKNMVKYQPYVFAIKLWHFNCFHLHILPRGFASKNHILNCKKMFNYFSLFCVFFRCGHECVRFCPVVRVGKQCVEVEELAASSGAASEVERKKTASISELLCVGCGRCVKKCPFDAIK